MQTHLVTGPGGAGVSSVAAALAVTLAGSADGATVTLACLGDDGSARRLLGAEPSLPVVDLARTRSWGRPDVLFASTVERFGGDGEVAEEWRRLPGADLVAALIALGEAVAVTDVLVVDLTDLRRAADLLAASVRVPWVLRGLLGLQALGARFVGPEGAHAVPRWLAALEAAAEVLGDGKTRLHLVRGSSAVEAAKVRRGAPALLLSGVSPGVVIGTPSPLGAPRPGRGCAESADTGDAAGTDDWAPFGAADMTTWPVVAATGALSDTAARAMAPVTAAIDALPALGSGLSRVDDRLHWRLPLPWLRADDVEVARRGADVIVTVHGVPHLLQPPAVLRRAVPVRAQLDGRYLDLESRLPEGAWRGDG